MLKKTQFILFFTVMICGAAVTAAQSTVSADAVDPVILKDKITEVTVYADRAQVKRTAQKYLLPGEHRLIFDKIPDSFQTESIRIDGQGNFILMDFIFKTVTYSEISRQEIHLIEKKQKDLKYRLDHEKDKITEIKKAKEFMGRVAKKVTDNKNKSDTSQLNPDNWIKMFDFYRAKNDTLNKERRAALQEIESINLQLQTLKEKKNAAEKLLNKSKNQVEVLVKVKKQGNIRLDLSYIVKGPGWAPVYDIRVGSVDKLMHITYSAMIQQNTSEDWNNVMIKLSTTQPGTSSSHPALTPWRISIQSEIAGIPKARNPWTVLNTMPGLTVDRPDVGGADSAQQNYFVLAPEQPGVGEENKWGVDGANVTAPITQDAELESGGISVLFVLKERNTIKSDNLAHKVIIMTTEFPAYFRYSCVPKLQARAYLKAKVKNSSGYPLLAGWANVFLDNSFICRTPLNYVSPDQEFWTWLGLDENIQVKYEFIRNYNKTTGILAKKNVIIYESLITVKNNKKTGEEVVIWDQVPISDNKELTIKYLEPEYKSDTSELKQDKHNFLEWRYQLKPGEEKQILFKFAIQYPKKMHLVSKK